MADYIDRQAAIDALGERPLNWDDNEFDLGLVVQFDADRRMLEAVPSVDAVKVVRCADCKHWDIFDIHSTICPDHRRCKGITGKMYTAPDYYCAYGERKDG